MTEGWFCPRCKRINSPWKDKRDCTSGLEPVNPFPVYPPYPISPTTPDYPFYPTITCKSSAGSTYTLGRQYEQN
jgi:hypothetical protein